MASPFPGMDPYLESDLWQEFHQTLASAIRAQLLPKLPSKYVALLSKRYVIDHGALGIVDVPHARVIYPDAQVATVRETATLPFTVEDAVDAPTLELPSHDEVPVVSIEIRDVADRRLVTVIEILSPVNKRGEGWREYVDRRDTLFKTQTHLLEIDLLRQGMRIPLVGELPPAPYYVFLSRFQHRPYTQIWPIALRCRLPKVPVPLLPPDPDVPLDLQAAVKACFDLVHYERLIDYAQPLSPPLDVAEAAWVEEQLHALPLPS
jgi:hypothetical protein